MSTTTELVSTHESDDESNADDYIHVGAAYLEVKIYDYGITRK